MNKITSLATTFIVCCAVTLAREPLSSGGLKAGYPFVFQTSEGERGLVALDQVLRELSSPFTVMALTARPEERTTGQLLTIIGTSGLGL